MKLFHELIREYAAAFPEKTALADSRGEMSYGELGGRSAALARALAAAGAGTGSAVAVYVPYTKEILLGAVSALRAGCVYIPFDDAYPEERLQYMLKDSDAAAILTVRELWARKRLDFPEEKVVFMDDPPEADGPDVCPEGLTEESPAMLLYTSGTTGNPKGVLHIQRMLTHLVDWMNIHEGAEMNADTRSGVMSGFSFVGTQMFLLGPLSKGGTVCVAPEAARKDVGYLREFLGEARVTHIFLPSGLAAIMAEDYDISGIFVFAAGEKLRNFRAHNPGNVLINSYGSTETSGVLSKKIRGDEERILVGKPFSNTKARIADEQLRPAAPGEAGELLIHNEFMSRGYYRQPELSREKWVALDGELWFRTGDRAAQTPDGDFELLGRTDNMVKLRGFRIETGEVEARIAGAAARLGRDDVGQVAVAVRTVGGTDRLTCYYEAKKELDRNAVTAEIAKTLAEYMIPEIWVRMDAFPRNANGKVIRKELPQPQRNRMLSGALDSEVVARLVWTLADVLGTDDFISPDERFTDLGGTSLTAMTYASRLREQGIRISAARVLKLNVLRKIAEAADVAYEQLWPEREYEAVRRDFAARGERIEKVLPVSSWQDEILFEQIMHPDWSHYRTVMFLQLDSAISREHLREALDAVAEENEELRAALVFHGVTVVQQVITDRKIPLEMTEAERFGAGEMAALRKRLLYEPMDLQRDSLLKVIGVHAGGETFLCVRIYRISSARSQLRGYLARMMRALESRYPADLSIRGWREILEHPLPSDRAEKPKVPDAERGAGVRRSAPPELCVYSEGRGPKMVFVHTGNTGSEAYYRLADRIRDDVSFAVIEPYNLYHPKDARRGIRSIAENYIRILKEFQPEGPYLLGGWCYGGVVAHEMACQLQRAGEEVRHLFLLDSHAVDESVRGLCGAMQETVNRTYFEVCPLFADLRAAGMLDAMVDNAAHVAEDMLHHTPSFYSGYATYFKPDQIPAGVTGENRRYWEKMMEFEAGNYERYCSREKLRIVRTPHEHDLMMDDPSLDIIVPEILRAIGPEPGRP